MSTNHSPEQKPASSGERLVRAAGVREQAPAVVADAAHHVAKLRLRGFRWKVSNARHEYWMTCPTTSPDVPLARRVAQASITTSRAFQRCSGRGCRDVKRRETYRRRTMNMEAPLEDTADEIERLERGMNVLASSFALPEERSGSHAERSETKELTRD